MWRKFDALFSSCDALSGDVDSRSGEAILPAAGVPAFAVASSTLYDNNYSSGVAQANAGSILCCTNSQDQSVSFPNDTAEAADDFTVPSGQQWSVSDIDVAGSYYAPFTLYASSVSVKIYSDIAGTPGTVVSSQNNLAPTGSLTNSNFSPSPITPVTLNSGTYWLSVQAVGSNFRWYWDDAPAGPGSQYTAVWQQPGQSDITGCASWSVRTTCIGDALHPDQAFRIVGSLTVGLTAVANGFGSSTEWHGPSGSGSPLAPSTVQTAWQRLPHIPPLSTGWERETVRYRAPSPRLPPPMAMPAHAISMSSVRTRTTTREYITRRSACQRLQRPPPPLFHRRST